MANSPDYGKKNDKNLAKDGIYELGPQFGLKDFTTTRDITRFKKIQDTSLFFSVNKFCSQAV